MIAGSAVRNRSDVAAHAGKLRNFDLAEWILLALLSAFFIVHAFVPAWRTLNSDFPNYYLGALLHHRGIPIDRIYEWTWFQRQNDQLHVRDGIVGFAPNPPAALLPAFPLTSWSPLAAKRVWLVLNLFFLSLSWRALREVTSLEWRRLALLSLLCIAPLHSNFLLGQYYVLLLLLLSLAFYAHQSEYRFTAGVLLGLAAALKLFPVVFFILLLSKNNWRGVAGMTVGIAGLTAASIGTTGMEVHRVFLQEILPQASRGDWLAPYDLQRNSFVTLWSHFFLREPELNPAPLMHSPMLYAFAQGVTIVALIFGFLWCIGDTSKRSNQLEWPAFVVLTLLLPSTTGTYHPTLLIFTAVVAGDALLRTEKRYQALTLLLLFLLASAPIPTGIAKHSPPLRLIAMIAMYVLLLHEMGKKRRMGAAWITAAVFAASLLAVVNLRAVDHHEEDYARRLAVPAAGFRSANPVAFEGRIAFTEMLQKRYSAEILKQGRIEDLPADGDVLSLSATPASPSLYLERTGAGQTSILRVPLTMSDASGQVLFPGQEPAVSHGGKWLAYIKEDGSTSAAWVTPTDQIGAPRLAVSESYHPLEVSVTDEGDVISSAGPASNPYLLIARRATGIVEPLLGISGPARYPAISPDEKSLAYSRREAGFWHLVIHNLQDGSERALTRGACNAITPSWMSNTSLLYATDCGRGIGLTALAQVDLSR